MRSATAVIRKLAFLAGTTLLLGAVGLAALWFVATQPYVRPIAWTGQKASPQRLESHVRQLAQVLPERSDDVDKLNKSAEYIFEEFQKYGEAEYQPFDVWGLRYMNVLLRLGPRERETVTIGAHYDAYDGLPGADDNASGVAGLIELARMVSIDSPDLRVELVAFALEEPPYFGTDDMGSFHHARRSRSDLTIVLEMIGYFQSERGSQEYPLPFLKYLYSDTGDFIALIGRLNEISAIRTMRGAFLGAADVKVHSLTFPPMLPGMSLSDHSNYWLHGRDAVMVTDTAYERNPNYHTKGDTPETLNYAKMAEVVTGIYASLFAFANDT